MIIWATRDQFSNGSKSDEIELWIEKPVRRSIDNRPKSICWGLPDTGEPETLQSASVMATALFRKRFGRLPRVSAPIELRLTALLKRKPRKEAGTP